MNEFRSMHLQKNLGEVLASAEEGPVVLLNRGQPRVVMMSAEEFRRLKSKAGEVVPTSVLPRRAAVVRQPERVDPLGYDTRDFLACARLMSRNALSNANSHAVHGELEAVRAVLGRNSSPTHAGVRR